MNILDENVTDSQRRLLRSKRVPVRQIGKDIGRKGMKDDEIIPLLQQLNQPTFLTLDVDFYDRRLCHNGYCLVHLDVEDDMVADFSRRLLRHPELNSKGKRMGKVIRVEPTGLALWQMHDEQESHLGWK